MIKVSVVVPVYNVEMYLAKCLNSLVNQTLKEIEIIVVNDGATDGSQNIIEQFKRDYTDKIRFFVKKNGGLSDARNFGIQYCSGKYIGFVDADDFVSYDMYEKLYQVAEVDKCDMVICDFEMVYSRKNKIVRDRRRNDQKSMFIDMQVNAWNKLYRREMIVKNQLTFPKGLYYEDVEFYCKAIPYLRKVSYLPEVLYFYIQRNGSITKEKGKKIRDIFSIFENVFNYYKANGVYDYFIRELEYTYARILLNSSFVRVSLLSDSKLRHAFAKETWHVLQANFSNWKENDYLKKTKLLRRIYMHTIYEFTICFYADFFHVVYNFKNAITGREAI